MNIWLIGSEELEGHDIVEWDEADVVVIKSRPEGADLVKLGMNSHLPIYILKGVDSSALEDLEIDIFEDDEDLRSSLEE